MRFIGIHLIQPADEIASSRRSTIVTLDATGRLEGVHDAAGDEEILRALPPPPALVVVDAPISVPNPRGRRMAEEVLAWCDVNVFPASRERLERLYGGLRGERLADRLDAAGYAVAESFPDVVLRQLEWESARSGAPPLPLERYREEWIGVRGPAFARRRDAPGPPAARRRALDLLGAPRDESLQRPGAIASLACAHAGLRSARVDLGGTLSLPVGAGRAILLPAGPELQCRAAVHLERLTPG
jgi:predicted nuclease with RNAse H fold